LNNFVLIGFMGVGKGSVARECVKQSDIFAIDTDDLIESIENKKIKEIFADSGEKYFRDLEKRTAIWLEKTISNTLISTGGGFFKVSNIKSIGKVVYLKSDFDSIYKRIIEHPNAAKKIKKRPLLKDKKEARKLHNERDKEYEKIADIIIDVREKTIEDVAKELLKKFHKGLIDDFLYNK
jgi:shikimate kinase